MIHQGRHPQQLTMGHGFTCDDHQTADRDAQLALAAAIVYLADIISAAEPA